MAGEAVTPEPGADQQVGARSGRLTGDRDDGRAWAVRSEEQARVAFPTRVRTRVRLVKQVVTEEVTQTFTVRREVLRVEEEPGDDPGAEPVWDRALPDDASERDFEIVLHAEQVVASTVVVPVERVRVSHRVATADVVVSADLRREQFTIDHDTTAPSAGTVPATTRTHEDTGVADGYTPTSKEESA